MQNQKNTEDASFYIFRGCLMKKSNIVYVVTMMIFIMLLAGCARHIEQDTEAILKSELLASHGIEISRPDNPYYTLVHHRRGEIDLEVMYHVLGEYGAYYFTPGEWTDKLILELVLVSDDGIRFAKDFLGIEVSAPLSFVFNVTEPDENHPFPIFGGGAAVGATVFISMEADLLPSLIVHEAVHAILRYDGRMSNFPHPPDIYWAMYLEEGLCNVIDFLFFLETGHDYDFNLYGRDRQAAENHLHIQALWSLDFNSNFENEAVFGLRYPKLMCYDTAASFIYFLLEYHGTNEDFMRVFDDIYLMEEVFGTSMEDMILKWLTYLDGFR
jgi:hypothetical protein